MIVVSDTTPLNYLILLDLTHVLPALFGWVYAPSAVIRELAHPHSPDSIMARRETASWPRRHSTSQTTCCASRSGDSKTGSAPRSRPSGTKTLQRAEASEVPARAWCAQVRLPVTRMKQLNFIAWTLRCWAWGSGPRAVGLRQPPRWNSP
jgi:hypothetical protein